MKTTFSIKSTNLPIIGMAIIFSLSVLIITGCGGDNKKGNAGDSNTVSADAATMKIEQRANAIVGKWETTTALDDKIMFDFGPSKKEGDAYTGTYTFYVNDTKDAPAKYIVSGDKMIKFFTDGGQEYPLIKVSVSDDGKTLIYFDQKDGQTQLSKVIETASKEGQAELNENCKVKNDNTDFFIEATEKTIKLKKGTPISVLDMQMHQGLIVVKAKVGNEWVRGEILLDDTTCN